MLILREKILKKNDLPDFTTDNKIIFDIFESENFKKLKQFHIKNRVEI